jgi:hypothetical protein
MPELTVGYVAGIIAFGIVVGKIEFKHVESRILRLTWITQLNYGFQRRLRSFWQEFFATMNQQRHGKCRPNLKMISAVPIIYQLSRLGLLPERFSNLHTGRQF